MDKHRGFPSVIATIVAGLLLVPVAQARADVLWSTLIDPTPGSTQIGWLSQQNSTPETEAIDDFVINPAAFPNGFNIASVLGQVLLTDPNATITNLAIEFYRTFPADSDPNRTPTVTRTNGPSDDGNEFAEFTTGDGNLSFTQTEQSPSFVLQTTIEPGADGRGTLETDPTTGRLLLLNMTLASPLKLAPTDPFPNDFATHYWLELTAEVSSGEFYWVQGTFPRTVPGTPPVAAEDRQTWFTTVPGLSPDFRRTSDIINGADGTASPVFNASMEIVGTPAIPEPTSLLLLGTGVLGLVSRLRRR
jgi:PEP-CTERM motif